MPTLAEQWTQQGIQQGKLQSIRESVLENLEARFDFVPRSIVKGIDEIVVELKSVQNLAKDHEVQLVNYLNGIKKDIGLLINFGPSSVQVKRKYRKPHPSNPVNPV